MPNVNVLDLKGKPVDKIALPALFDTPYRPNLIRRAFLSVTSYQYQPQGVDPLAGKKTTAHSWGVGHGVSRIPRVKGSRTSSASKGAFIAFAVGGRRAFPPKVEKVTIERINQKERVLATRSAIAATGKRELVLARGHKVSDEIAFPIICVDDLEKVEKTQEIVGILEDIGIGEDLLRTKSSKKIRAGRGKTRGRKYKQAVSALIVAKHGTPIYLSSRNVPGVTVCSPSELSVGHLAPGGVAGRLTIWTTSALNEMKSMYQEAKK